MIVSDGTTAVQLQPQSQPRQKLPDQLRGLALLGIVFVNMPFLALSNGGLFEVDIDTPLDGLVAFVIVAFAQGKFYLLFSFLFGYSFTLILRRRTPDSFRRYRRRLVGLAVLGILHGTLFFIGDILLSYAVLGIVLLWFAARSTRTALVAAAIAYGIGLLVLGVAVAASVGADLAGAGIVSNPTALDQALRGSFVDGALGRAAVLPEALLFQVFLNWFPALAMFLLGLAAGRTGVLSHPEKHGRLWRTLLVVAAAVGVPAGLAAGWLAIFADDPTGFLGVLSVVIGFGTAPALTGGYVALAALATNTRTLALAAPAGRMSLTGYLGESILLAATFCGWGLGLFGQLSIAEAALVTLLVWISLEIFAALWLGRFTHGPFEWLLRCWSAGSWLPLRLRPSDQVLGR
jgi:uncharacterized protein